METLRFVATNDSNAGGTALTPIWFGFHDNSFDLFDVGEASSAGLEAAAEDGNFSPLGAELTADDADGVGGVILGAAGPIVAGERTTAQVTVDGASNGFLSLAAMLLPSNDAFIGTDDAIQLFDADGNFLGAQTISFGGGDVYDAGTEVNTELDAAFINQTAANTGVDENGVVTQHPGFNGSLGNPDGDQIILGGTNAFGQFIDPGAADFSSPGADIATVHINIVESEEGTSGNDRLVGSEADNIFTGGDGQDLIYGLSGWDELYGGDGDDRLRGGHGNDVLDGGDDNDQLFGALGADTLHGGEGDDLLVGGHGDDVLFGDAGDDTLEGGRGADVLAGGAGNDQVDFGRGTDTFIFSTGDGADQVFNASSDDLFIFDVEGVDSFEGLLGTAQDSDGTVTFDFSNGDSVTLNDVFVSDLSAEQFLFA